MHVLAHALPIAVAFQGAKQGTFQSALQSPNTQAVSCAVAHAVAHADALPDALPDVHAFEQSHAQAVMANMVPYCFPHVLPKQATHAVPHILLANHAVPDDHVTDALPQH